MRAPKTPWNINKNSFIAWNRQNKNTISRSANPFTNVVRGVNCNAHKKQITYRNRIKTVMKMKKALRNIIKIYSVQSIQ